MEKDMLKNSVKLTAIGLGLVSFALISCKDKDSKDNSNSPANKAGQTTETKNTEKLEVSFSSKSLSLKGGCAIINVSYTDAKGNKSPNLAALNDKDFSIGLDAESKKYFDLVGSEICSKAEAKDGQKATIIAKYNNLFASNTISTVKEVFNAIKTDLTDKSVVFGEKVTFNLKGFANSTVAYSDDKALDTLTDTNYAIEVIDTATSTVVANAVSFNAKTKVWELNTKLLGYQADAKKSAENEKLLKIKAISKKNAAEFYELNLAKVTIEAPAVKYVKFEGIKSNFLANSTNKLNFVAVYSDDSVKPIAIKDITFEVKDNSNATVTGIEVNNGHLEIASSIQNSATSGKFYTLTATASNKIVATPSNGNNSQKIIFVIGENAPEVQFNFRELGLSKSFNVVNDALTAKVLAKGASLSDIDFIKLDETYAKNNCVKVLPSLKIGATVLNSLITFNESELTNSDADSFTNNFTVDSNGIICAKKEAVVNTELALNYKFQGIESKPLTVKVGDAIITSKISAGIEGKSIVEFKNLKVKEEAFVKAYYTYTDGKISTTEANATDAAKFKFEFSNANTPFTLAKPADKWIVSHAADLSAQYLDQVNEISVKALDLANNAQIANGDKLVVKFAK